MKTGMSRLVVADKAPVFEDIRAEGACASGGAVVKRLHCPMKTPVLLAAAICALPLAVFAQNPPPAGAPPAGAPPAGAPPAPGAPATGAKPAAKPVPLNASEKKFLKDSTEGMYLVMDLTGQGKTNATTETAKKLSEKVKAEFDKIWGDVAGFASANNEPVPKELKGGDKSASERLKKADKGKWDKEFVKIGGKEIKKLTKAFTDTKSMQNAEIKAIADKWRATMSGLEGEFDAAEKEVAKAK